MSDLREEIAEAAYRVAVERNENWIPGLPATPWEQQTEYIHGLYRAIADSMLATDGVHELIEKASRTDAAMHSFSVAQDLAFEQEAVIERVRKEIEEEERYHADLPAWEITVSVPNEVTGEARDKLFEAVADAACDAMGEGHEDCPNVVGAPAHESVPLHILRRALGGE